MIGRHKTYTILIIYILVLFSINISGQNNSLILNGAFININNGSWNNPVYLVVNSGQPSAIQRNSGHIISEKEGNFVQWNTADVTATTNYIIPFGYGNTDYLPVTVHKNSVGSGAGHIDNSSPIAISTWGTPSDNIPLASSVTSMTGPNGADAINSVIDRWWQLLAGTNVSATFDVTYRGSENTTASPDGIFNGQQFDIPTDQWISASGSGTGVTSINGSVSNISLYPHGMNTSSPYVLSSDISPLPIELILFESKCHNDLIHINWTTASEINVSEIELQKSYDLNSWTTVYNVIPSNLNSKTEYNFEFQEISEEIIYFRLKSTDIDGTIETSESIYLEPCNSKKESLTANSNENIIYVNSIFKKGSIVNYQIYDIAGKLVSTGSYYANSGVETFSISVEHLSNAIYIFKAESTTSFCNQKLIISNP